MTTSLVLGALLALAGQEPPPDLTGRVISAFEDGPATMLTIHVGWSASKRDHHEASVYLRPGTKIGYVGLKYDERRPMAGHVVWIWLEKDSRDGAAAARFGKERALQMNPEIPVPPPPPPPVAPAPPVPSPGTVTLEAETFKIEGAEVRDFGPASNGKALFFGKEGGRGRITVDLKKGTYEIRILMQGRSTNHDAILLTVAGRQQRFYQDRWGLLAPGKVKDVERALVEIPQDGAQRISIDFAETDVWVDRVTLLRVVPATAPDEEGFIRHWLVLAPIPSEKEMDGKREIEREQIEAEKNLRPRANQPVKIRGRTLTWRPIQAPDWFIEFPLALTPGQGQTVDATAYAVCLLIAAEEMKELELRMGSNDQGRVYLNGKEVLKHAESRSLTRDPSVAKGLTLKKGENLVVFKVVNEKGGWQGCLRFVRPDGKPVRNLKVTLPE